MSPNGAAAPKWCARSARRRSDPPRLQSFPDAQMELGATSPGEPVVQRSPNQLVGEPVRKGLGRELLDHAAGEGLLERRQEVRLVEARGRPHRLQLELRPRGRRQAEQLPRFGAQPSQALADDLAHALRCAELSDRALDRQLAAGRADHFGLQQGPPQLADEERVSPGQLVDRRGQLPAGVRPPARGSLDEIPDLGIGEALEAHPDDVIRAIQVGERVDRLGREFGLAVAEGRDHQEPGPGLGPRQVAEEEEGRGVGPVAVLEDQQQRRPLARAGEQPGHRRVETVTFGVRVGAPPSVQSLDPAGEIGQQPDQLSGSGPERGRQLVVVHRRHQDVERFDERPVGSSHDSVAAAAKLSDAALQPGGELPRESRLAGPRRAAQQDDPLALPGRARHQRAEQSKLLRASRRTGGSKSG